MILSMRWSIHASSCAYPVTIAVGLVGLLPGFPVREVEASVHPQTQLTTSLCFSSQASLLILAAQVGIGMFKVTSYTRNFLRRAYFPVEKAYYQFALLVGILLFGGFGVLAITATSWM